jgi:hypothetical protein
MTRQQPSVQFIEFADVTPVESDQTNHAVDLFFDYVAPFDGDDDLMEAAGRAWPARELTYLGEHYDYPFAEGRSYFTVDELLGLLETTPEGYRLAWQYFSYLVRHFLRYVNTAMGTHYNCLEDARAVWEQHGFCSIQSLQRAEDRLYRSEYYRAYRDEQLELYWQRVLELAADNSEAPLGARLAALQRKIGLYRDTQVLAAYAAVAAEIAAAS